MEPMHRKHGARQPHSPRVVRDGGAEVTRRDGTATASKRASRNLVRVQFKQLRQFLFMKHADSRPPEAQALTSMQGPRPHIPGYPSRHELCEPRRAGYDRDSSIAPSLDLLRAQRPTMRSSTLELRLETPSM